MALRDMIKRIVCIMHSSQTSTSCRIRADSLYNSRSAESQFIPHIQKKNQDLNMAVTVFH